MEEQKIYIPGAWKGAWKYARGEYETYEDPIVAEDKHEEIQTGKRNKRTKKVSDPESSGK